MPAKPSNPNRVGMFPGDPGYAPAKARIDPIEWSYGNPKTVAGDPNPSAVKPPAPPPPAPPAAGGGGLTPSPGGSSTNMGNLPRTGGTVPTANAPTSRAVEGSTMSLGDVTEGPSSPMIHGPAPRFNGPIVRPIAGPSFGPGMIPGRGTPKRSGGYHPPDYQR